MLVNFDDEALEDQALARGLIRLNIDPDAVESSSSFARPLPENLALFGLTEDDTRFGITSATLNEETNTYSFGSTNLTAILQDILLGNALFVRFEAKTTTSPISLGVLPLVLGPPPADGDPDPRPRVALTVVPTD